MAPTRPSSLPTSTDNSAKTVQSVSHNFHYQRMSNHMELTVSRWSDETPTKPSATGFTIRGREIAQNQDMYSWVHSAGVVATGYKDLSGKYQGRTNCHIWRRLVTANDTLYCVASRGLNARSGRYGSTGIPCTYPSCRTHRSGKYGSTTSKYRINPR